MSRSMGIGGGGIMGSVDIWRYNSYPTPKYPGMVYPSQVSLPYDGYDVGGGNMRNMHPLVVFFFSPFFFIHTRIFPASGQAVVTGVVPSSPPFLPPILFAHRVQQSHCSSTVRRVLLSQATWATSSSLARALCSRGTDARNEQTSRHGSKQITN